MSRREESVPNGDRGLRAPRVTRGHLICRFAQLVPRWRRGPPRFMPLPAEAADRLRTLPNPVPVSRSTLIASCGPRFLLFFNVLSF